MVCLEMMVICISRFLCCFESKYSPCERHICNNCTTLPRFECMRATADDTPIPAVISAVKKIVTFTFILLTSPNDYFYPIRAQIPGSSGWRPVKMQKTKIYFWKMSEENRPTKIKSNNYIIYCQATWFINIYLLIKTYYLWRVTILLIK